MPSGCNVLLTAFSDSNHLVCLLTLLHFTFQKHARHPSDETISSFFFLLLLLLFGVCSVDAFKRFLGRKMISLCPIVRRTVCGWVCVCVCGRNGGKRRQMLVQTVRQRYYVSFCHYALPSGMTCLCGGVSGSGETVGVLPRTTPIPSFHFLPLRAERACKR